MKSRQSNVPAIAAAKAGFSTATAYRIEADPRGCRRRRSPEGAAVPIYSSECRRDRADAGGRPWHPRGLFGRIGLMAVDS